MTFTNESTKEYLFHTITFTSTNPNVLEVIELETPARRSITHNITLENPLSTPATFSITCDNEDISFPPTITCNAGWVLHRCRCDYDVMMTSSEKLTRCRSVTKAEITFLPLTAKENVSHLTINSPQLGLYVYDLKLKSTPASNDKPMHYKAGLGT